MRKSEKCAVYTILDPEQYEFMFKDVNEHKMTIKGWLEMAIEQMRKLRLKQSQEST